MKWLASNAELPIDEGGDSDSDSQQSDSDDSESIACPPFGPVSATVGNFYSFLWPKDHN